MDTCTNSDHKAVIARLELNYFIAPYSAARIKKSNHKRTIFLYDKATKENWDNYREELEKQICGKVNVQGNIYNTRSGKSQTEKNQLDIWWEQISNGILAAARKTLPKRKVDNTMTNKRKHRETRLGKTLTQLGRWIKIGKLNLSLGFLKDNIEDLNEEIKYINDQHGVYIEEVQEMWTQEVIEDLKGWWKILRARRSWEIDNQRKKEIEENVERRCQMIDGEQGQMLSSLLEKPNRKIKIDKLIKTTENGRELLIEPEEVLEETKKHY